MAKKQIKLKLDNRNFNKLVRAAKKINIPVEELISKLIEGSDLPQATKAKIGVNKKHYDELAEYVEYIRSLKKKKS